jgi:dsRNA-specific ribonuclease
MDFVLQKKPLINKDSNNKRVSPINHNQNQSHKLPFNQNNQRPTSSFNQHNNQHNNHQHNHHQHNNHQNNHHTQHHHNNHHNNHHHKVNITRESDSDKDVDKVKPKVSTIIINEDANKTPILEQGKPLVQPEIDDENKKINPYNFNNRFIKKNEIENILRRYGIYQTINDLGLYQQAFTHDSYCWAQTKEIMERDEVQIVDKPEGAIELQNISYQRLEFLGDRVINLIIAFYLFERYPKQNEGFLTKIYSKIVDSKGLSKLARKVNFGQFILFSRHLDEKNNARTKDKYLEDCFEAFIGALFYDFATKLNASGYVTAADFIIGPGFQICQKFIVNLIEDEETCIDFVELIGKDRNYKQKINTYFQTFGLKGKYTVDKNENIYILDEGEIVFGSESDDPPSKYAYQDRIWWVSLKDNQDKLYGTAYARERQQAEQKCAYLSLVKMGREKNQNDPDFDDPELDEWISVYNNISNTNSK